MVALTIPGVRSVGLQSTRVYHSSLPAQVRSSFFGVRRFCPCFYGRTIVRQFSRHARCSSTLPLHPISPTFRQALTCFSILSNIRPFPGGSPVMPRTSRCFAGTFLQLGGPHTLLSVEHFPVNLSFADFSFAHFQSF